MLCGYIYGVNFSPSQFHRYFKCHLFSNVNSEVLFVNVDIPAKLTPMEEYLPEKLNGYKHLLYG